MDDRTLWFLMAHTQWWRGNGGQEKVEAREARDPGDDGSVRLKRGFDPRARLFAYPRERKRSITLPAAAFVSSLVGLTLYLTELWLPFFCLALFGTLSCCLSFVLRCGGLDRVALLDMKVPEDEERHFRTVAAMRFWGSLCNFLPCTVYPVFIVLEYGQGGSVVAAVISVLQALAMLWVVALNLRDMIAAGRKTKR